MTLDKSVTDDQLGKFYRRVSAIASRIGKSLSFSDVMNALQHLHDGTLRVGLNTAEDLQQLLQRPSGAKKIVGVALDVPLPAIGGKAATDCFKNKQRYPSVYIHEALAGGHRTPFPEFLPTEDSSRLTVYTMTGMASHAMLAAELLGVPDETPVGWLQQLLVKRRHTLSLPALEYVIDQQTEGREFGIAPPLRHANDYCGNIAFTEVRYGQVDVIYINRDTPKRWRLSRESLDAPGTSRRDNDRLVVRT